MASRHAGGPGRRDEVQDFRRSVKVSQIRNLGAERIGDHLIKLRFIDQPALDHYRLDRAVPSWRPPVRKNGLFPTQVAGLDKDVCDLFGVHVSRNLSWWW